jgi:hypothetical protein
VVGDAVGAGDRDRAQVTGACAELVKLEVARRLVQFSWLPVRLESRTVKVSTKYLKLMATITAPQPPLPSQLLRRGEQYQSLLDTDPNLTRAEVARQAGVSRAAVTQAIARFVAANKVCPRSGLRQPDRRS